MIPKKLYSELIDLLFVQSHTSNEKRMVIYLINQLNMLGLDYTIDNVGNILVTKSSGNKETYPCVVSHMDTVHRLVDNYQVYKNTLKTDIKLFAGIKNDDKKETATGIGGDDKCGVFACLYFLKTLPDVKVVFFTQEEGGCKGSVGINTTFFDDVRYIIQLDRRGAHDFISKNFRGRTVSQMFSSEIGHLKKKYKFKTAQGTITDAVKLWENDIGISCLNLSCGYYSPHSDNEYIMVEELWNSILFTKEMIHTLKDKIYVCKKPKEVTYSSTSTYIVKKYCRSCKEQKEYGVFLNGIWKCYVCMHKDNDSKDSKCEHCNKPTKHWKLTYNPDLNMSLCAKCLVSIKKPSSKLDKCDICGIWRSPDIMTYTTVIEMDGELKVKKEIGLCLDCCDEADWKRQSMSTNKHEKDKYSTNNALGVPIPSNSVETAIVPSGESFGCDMCSKIFPTTSMQAIGRDTFVCPKCHSIATGHKI